MLGKAPPRTGSLNLVKLDLDLAAADQPDVKIAMADLVESLDTRELDIDEGEETDYDGSALGEFFRCHMALKLVKYTTKTEVNEVTGEGSHVLALLE